MGEPTGRSGKAPPDQQDALETLLAADTELDGDIHPGVAQLNEHYRQLAEQHGCLATVEAHGILPIAASVSPHKDDQEKATTIFLKQRRWLLKAAISGSFLSAVGWVAGQEATLLGADRHLEKLNRRIGWLTKDDVPLESEWNNSLAPILRMALRARNLELLDELKVNSPYRAIRWFAELTYNALTGDFGAALQNLQGEDQWQDRAPDFMLPDFLHAAARAYSIAGHANDSVRMYERLKGLDSFQMLRESSSLTDRMQIAELMRAEVNHRLQTADSAPLYYGLHDAVLAPCRRLQIMAEELTGHTLDDAMRVDERVGASIINMREYLNWIDARRNGDTERELDALKEQHRAIKMLCPLDRRVGPMRYSPMVGQVIRSGHWGWAQELQCEQLEAWAANGEPISVLRVRHRCELGIYLILRAIIAGRGFARFDNAFEDLKEARALLRGPTDKSHRFYKLIDSLNLEFGTAAGVDVRKRRIFQINAQNEGHQGGEFYFFGDLQPRSSAITH